MRTTQQANDRFFTDAWTGFATTFGNAVMQVKTLVRVLRNRRLAQNLAELDDYLLHDIGLMRTELENELLADTYLSDPTVKLAQHARKRANKQIPSLSLG